MKTTQEKIAIMQAFVDGKEVECRRRALAADWWALEKNIPTEWSWGTHDYRIKEDMEQKAVDVFCAGFNVTKYELGPWSSARRGWRAVIDAVKRGEIT
jgi:hypothetical protein